MPAAILSSIRNSPGRWLMMGAVVALFGGLILAAWIEGAI